MHKRLIAGGLTLIAAVLLAACGMSPTPDGGSQSNVTTANTDPKHGPVFVRTTETNGYQMATVKFCDGTTLVYNFVGYYKGGGAVIENSKECQS